MDLTPGSLKGFLEETAGEFWFGIPPKTTVGLNLRQIFLSTQGTFFLEMHLPPRGDGLPRPP